MGIRETLLADADAAWIGSKPRTNWREESGAYGAALQNGATISSGGGLVVVKASQQSADADGDAITHRMSGVTWVVRCTRSTDNQPGCVLKVGWSDGMTDPEQYGSQDGWGVGFGGSNFDSNGNRLILLRERLAWHSTTRVVSANRFTSLVVRLKVGGGFDVYDGDFKAATSASSPSAGPSSVSPTVRFGGYRSAGSIDNNRFFGGVVHDALMLTRDLTSDERLWLADSNNLLLADSASIRLPVRTRTRLSLRL